MIRKQLPKENNRVVMSPSFRRSQIRYLETQLPCEHRFIFRTRTPTILGKYNFDPCDVPIHDFNNSGCHLEFLIYDVNRGKISAAVIEL